MTWKTYRHRFLPWILLNWKRRFRRNDSSKIHFNENKDGHNLLQADLHTFLKSLNHHLQQELPNSESTPFSYSHIKQSFKRDTEFYNTIAVKCAKEVLGFTIYRGPSSIEDAGMGVFISTGAVAKDRLVAVYPGLIYEPGEPIFLQSIFNQFIFRCQDGVLIDGNDRGISKMLYRSCAGREITGGHLLCDISWLTSHPINILGIGQYINNHNQDNPANVEYQEIDLDADFPAELLKYIPNICYSTDHHYGHQRARRVVVLRSLKDIKSGEELLSTYFTMTTK